MKLIARVNHITINARTNEQIYKFPFNGTNDGGEPSSFVHYLVISCRCKYFLKGSALVKVALLCKEQPQSFARSYASVTHR
jgi:hypothetical protein